MAGLLLAALISEVGLGLPRNAAVEGGRVDDLLVQTAALSALVAVGLGGVLLIAVVRRRRAASPPRPWLTVIGTLLVFGAIDGNLLLHGDLAQARADGDVAAVRYEVNAHQWAWDIRAAGEDGRFGTTDDVVTLNSMVVPVGVPVDVELASVDVVHGFSIPNLRIKADAVPGQITHLSFAAVTEGDYEIACAQHCGLNHYKMRGILHVVSTGDYRAWQQREGRQALAGDDPSDAAAHWAWPWDGP